MIVGGLHGLGAAEGADEHEERGLGQVEVGDQRVNDVEVIAGLQKNVRAHRAFPAAQAFKRAQNGCADRDDAAAFGLGTRDLGGVGGIAGGYLAKVLIDLLESLAPLAGGALGAFVLLVFVREKQESNRRQKQQD